MSEVDSQVRVVDHEPYAWFLFKSEEDLLFDVNCNHSAVGYSVTIRLSAEEASEYAHEGHAYLNRLSRAVQNSGPGGSHQLRDVSATYSKEAMQAMREWRAAQERH